jgi:hypothetical protein
VTVACSPATIFTTQTTTCTATVAGTGSYSHAVAWSATNGSVTQSGVFTPSGAGTGVVTAKSTEDSTKSGSSSITASVPATLQITAADLPSGALANILVVDPNGNQTTVNATQNVYGVAGSYTITPTPVVSGTNTYYPSTGAQTVSIPTGDTTSVEFDYINVMPNTTKILDATAMAGLTISTDSSVLTIPAASTVAQSLQIGDVIVVPNTTDTGVAPYGLLRKVDSLSNTAASVVATTEDAALTDAFSHLEINTTVYLTPEQTTNMTLAPGTHFIPNPHDDLSASKYSTSPNDSGITNPCNGSQYGEFTFTQQVSQELGSQFQLSGNVILCAAIPFSISEDAESASIGANLGAYTKLTLTGTVTETYKSGDIDLGSWIGPQFELPLLPIIVTPQFQLIVGATATGKGTLSADAMIRGTVSSSAQYANGDVTIAPAQSSLDFGYDSPTFSGTLDATAYAGVTTNFIVVGKTMVSVTPEVYLEFKAQTPQQPPWQLYAGARAPFALNLNYIGFSKKPYTGKLFDVEELVAQAINAACSFTITPDTLTVPATGAKGTFTVNANNSSCAWNLVEADEGAVIGSLISVTPTSGTGNGTVSYTINNDYEAEDNFIAVGSGLTMFGANNAYFTGDPSTIGIMNINTQPTKSDLQITSQMLAPVINGQPYFYQLQATGGAPPYTWDAYNGDPIPYLGIQYTTDGTFTTNGQPVQFVADGEPYPELGFSYGIEVTDSAGNKAVAVLPYFLYSTPPS